MQVAKQVGKTSPWVAVIALAFSSALLLSAEIRTTRVASIAFPVADLDRSVRFFSEVLDFREVARAEDISADFDRLTGIFGTNVRAATLQLGTETVKLVQYVTPEGRPVPLDSRSHDGWFQHIAIVVSDMEKAYERVNRYKVSQISTAPQTLPEWNQAAAGIQAFYFRDPDNHPLELIYFPPGKGDPKWQHTNGDLFLGIDHTAIAVSDTDRSVLFYESLGFRVAGNSLNYGTEQEHLNHVFGSRVRITGMRAAAGPGIEFLDYITPRSGRPYPAGSRPNDLWHLHTTLFVDNLVEALEELQRLDVTFISSDAAALKPLDRSAARGVLIRDPDGHAVLIRNE